MSCEQTPEPRTAGDCGPCSPARRNRYFPDKWMTSADYRLEQNHLIERRRLVNRAMLGPGIAQGFQVDFLDSGGVSIGTGVAIDCCGRELVACERVELAHAADVLWLGEAECGPAVIDPPKPPVDEGKKQRSEKEGKEDCPPDERPHHYLLCAHYAERPIEGIPLDDGCGSKRCEANYVCETVVYSLTCVEHCPPGPRDCLPNLWMPEDCGPGDGEWEAVTGVSDHPRVAKVHDRGTHKQLVHWSMERLEHVDFCKPCKTEKVGELYVDLHGCVPLACVKIGYRCDEAYITGIVDDWRPKRLARPNNILFDLIRGCDLVRIQDVGWSTWLAPDRRRVPWADFAKKFIPPSKKRKTDPVDTRFWICFSGPVQLSSLTPDIMTITLLERENDEYKQLVKRIPIVGIAAAPHADGDPPNTTRACRPLVARRYWHGEIDPNDATGFERPTRVEIEVRTRFILDAYGQEVAGGGRFVPSNGCTPGGSFLSCFTVLEAPQDVDEDDEDYAETPAEDEDETAQQGASPLAEEA